MKAQRALVLTLTFSACLPLAAAAVTPDIDATVRDLNSAVAKPLVDTRGACAECARAEAARSASLSAPLSERDLLQQIRNFHSVIAGPDFTAANCGPYLSKIYGSVFRASPGYFDRKLLEQSAKAIIDEIFSAKLELRNTMARLEKSGPLPADCVEGIRNTMRAALFLSEYVAEHFIPGLGTDRVFKGAGPELLVNPKFGPNFGANELKSGDVLMSRGDAFVSGAISRIGDNDGNFSHIAMVYVDPDTKQAYTVEAHIELGVVVAPLDKYLTDGKVRATVFRQGDAELAHNAAKLMYERAKKQSATGKNIPYDFGMVLEGKDPKGRAADAEVFCSEVAYLGYRDASDGKLVLPRYPTGLHMKNDKFLKDIGVASERTFAPSDMEVESRFELVAEWRNFKKTEKSRMTDAILTQTYDTMEKRGYELRNSAGDAVKRDLAYSLRKLGFMKEKLPDNMSRSAIGTMIALDKTAGPMLAELEKANRAQKEKTGFAMTAPQMLDFLNELREKDYEAYLAWKKYQQTSPAAPAGDDAVVDTRPVPPAPLYHKVFRPKGV